MRGGGNDSADESGEEDPKKKKQKKKGRGGDEEEVEDIDEDAELALLQAVQEAELDSQSSQLQAQRQPPKQQQRRSSPITYTSPNKKRLIGCCSSLKTKFFVQLGIGLGKSLGSIFCLRVFELPPLHGQHPLQRRNEGLELCNLSFPFGSLGVLGKTSRRCKRTSSDS